MWHISSSSSSFPYVWKTEIISSFFPSSNDFFPSFFSGKRKKRGGALKKDVSSRAKISPIFEAFWQDSPFLLKSLVHFRPKNFLSPFASPPLPPPLSPLWKRRTKRGGGEKSKERKENQTKAKNWGMKLYFPNFWSVFRDILLLFKSCFYLTGKHSTVEKPNNSFSDAVECRTV